MQQRPGAGDQTLLIDFISANMLVAVWRACKSRYWAMLLAIGGSILLRLIIIFSTGLLILEPAIMIDKKAPVASIAQFDSQSFQSSLTSDTTAGNSSRLGAAAMTYYGILKYDLPYPNGTLANAAYQSVAPLKPLPPGATMIVDVIGFYPELDCELAKVDASIRPSLLVTTDVDLDVTFSVRNCSLDHSWANVICDPSRASCPERGITGLWGLINKGDGCVASADDMIAAFAVADIRYEQTKVPEYSSVSPGNSPWTIYSSTLTLSSLQASASPSAGLEKQNLQHIANLAGVLCRPHYSLRNSTLSVSSFGAIDQLKPNLTVHPGARETQLFGVNGSSVMNAIWKSFLNGPAYTDSQPNFTSSTGAAPDNGIMYNLMMMVQGHSKPETLLDPEILMRSARSVYQAVASQVALTGLIPNNETVIGEIKYPEYRIQVKILPVWLMSSGFVLMMCVCGSLLLLRPKDVVSRDPTSLAAMAAILTTSQKLNRRLLNMGHANLSSFRKRLSGSLYITTIKRADRNPAEFYIDERRQPSNLQEFRSSPSLFQSPEWWQPRTLQLPFLVVISLVIVSLIAALEIFQRISDRNNGVRDTKSDSKTHFASNVLPAAVLSIIDILFGSVDSNTRLFAPYKMLVKNGAPAYQSIVSQYNGKNSVFVMIKALKHRHVMIIFSAFGATLASYLTIIVSGLYTVDDVPTTTYIELHRTDYFNSTGSRLYNDDDHAGVIYSLIRGFNLSYPRFTYGELTFPTMQLPGNMSANSSLQNTTNSSLTAVIPAIRASLNCSQVPDEDIQVPYEDNDIQTDPSVPGGPMDVKFRAPLPPDCRRGGSGRNMSYIDYEISLTFPVSSTWEYQGNMVDLLFSNRDPSTGILTEEPPANPEGCPSLVFLFGSYTKDTTSASNTSILVCSQFIEEVETEITFILPDLSIDLTHPPIPNESTVKAIDNGTKGSIYREYQVATNLANQMIDPTDVGASTIVGFGQGAYDFYHILTDGSGTKLAPAALVGAENAKLLFNVTQHMYRVYMAQAMNLKFRETYVDMESSISQTPKTTFPATIHGPTRSRLKQDNSTKLALQILLGVLFLLGALTRVTLGSLKGIFPHDRPCSIAGMASLLAGSDLVSCSRKVIPEGAEWMDDKEWKKKGIFEGWVFGLGWWWCREQVKDGAGRDSAGAEKEVRTGEGIDNRAGDGEGEMNGEGEVNREGEMNREGDTSGEGEEAREDEIMARVSGHRRDEGREDDEGPGGEYQEDGQADGRDHSERDGHRDAPKGRGQQDSEEASKGDEAGYDKEDRPDNEEVKEEIKAEAEAQAQVEAQVQAQPEIREEGGEGEGSQASKVNRTSNPESALHTHTSGASASIIAIDTPTASQRRDPTTPASPIFQSPSMRSARTGASASANTGASPTAVDNNTRESEKPNPMTQRVRFGIDVGRPDAPPPDENEMTAKESRVGRLGRVLFNLPFKGVVSVYP